MNIVVQRVYAPIDCRQAIESQPRAKVADSNCVIAAISVIFTPNKRINKNPIFLVYTTGCILTRGRQCGSYVSTFEEATTIESRGHLIQFAGSKSACETRALIGCKCVTQLCQSSKMPVERPTRHFPFLGGVKVFNKFFVIRIINFGFFFV
ncbi:hypothetical protein AU476_09460 [Cupriavidus sp. UYMSc13B]|nr:hypothetical protein AU476_09460 [Cupriavidus sp. UYMSc13B]